ncbi:MAG: cell wall-binding repeat-containing protein, partial [Gracilibacteraceae bacterium]|nr:cell wall-binding repeat-containing protein [Gracilibacteraceae bacterium]
MNKVKKISLILGLALAVVFATAPPLRLGATDAAPDRLSGSDRYQTAINISQTGWPSARNAVLASGADANLVDALTVAPLAKLLDAPILITAGGALSSGVAAELKRLDVETVYISSGPGVIRQPVLDAVRALGVDIVTLGGDDRFATAANIAAEIAKRAEISTVVVTTAYSNADALSVASIAAASGWPILLTGRDELPVSARSFITGHNVSNTYVIGGSGVVSDSLAESLPNSIRLGGLDRYGTNSIIVTYFMTYWKYMKGVYVANGANNHLVDALAASSYIAGAPLILTDNSSLSHDMRQFLLNMLSSNYEIKKVIGLGGPTVTSDFILQEVITALAGVPLTLTGGGGGGGGGRNVAALPALSELEITGPNSATFKTSRAVDNLRGDDLVIMTYLRDAAKGKDVGFSLTSDSGTLHRLTFSQPLSPTYWLDLSPAAAGPLDPHKTLKAAYLPDYAEIVASAADVQTAIARGKTIITVSEPLYLTDNNDWRLRDQPVTVNLAARTVVAESGALAAGAGVTVVAFDDMDVAGRMTIDGELITTADSNATVSGELAVRGKFTVQGELSVLSAGAVSAEENSLTVVAGAFNTQAGSTLAIKANGKMTVEDAGQLTVAAGTNGDLAGELTVRSGGEFTDNSINLPVDVYGWAWPAPPSSSPGQINLEVESLWLDGNQGLGGGLRQTSGNLTVKRDSVILTGAAHTTGDLNIPAHLTLQVEGASVLTVSSTLTAVNAIAAERNARLTLASGAEIAAPASALTNGTEEALTYLFNRNDWAELSARAAAAVDAFSAVAAVTYDLAGPAPHEINSINLMAEQITLAGDCDIGAANLIIENGGELIVPYGRKLFMTDGNVEVRPSALLSINGETEVDLVQVRSEAVLNVGAAGSLKGGQIDIDDGAAGAVNGSVTAGRQISDNAADWPWQDEAAGSVILPYEAKAFYQGDQVTGVGGYLETAPGAEIIFQNDRIIISHTAHLRKALSLPAGIALVIRSDSTLVLDDSYSLTFDPGADFTGLRDANLKLENDTALNGNIGGGESFQPNNLYYSDGSAWTNITAGVANVFAPLGYDGVSYTNSQVSVTGEAVLSDDLTMTQPAPLLVKAGGHLSLNGHTLTTAGESGRGRLEVEAEGALTISSGSVLAAASDKVVVRGLLEAEDGGKITGQGTVRFQDEAVLRNNNL